jgi:hypothetical protein
VNIADVPLKAVPGEILQSGDRFRSFADRCKDERPKRIAIGKRRLDFGVKFLNKALGGIFPNDLILIGARTGKGKTHLATLAAMENARDGKTVHFFALEAEEDEIERRAKFSILSEMIRAGCRATGSWARMDRMNYLDWYAGDLEDITDPFESQVAEVLATKYKTLHTLYRTTDFYAEHFETLVREVRDTTDLIILDHLHYVDSNEPSENKGYKQIVKKIRDTALSLGKPVIVIAHLRKSDRHSGRIVPDEEDFHGTSDVPKMATKAVLIAPAFDCPSDDPWVWPTYFNVAKCRPDGARTRFVGRVAFDARSGKYLEPFDLGTLSVACDKFELVDNSKMPAWAK